MVVFIFGGNAPVYIFRNTFIYEGWLFTMKNELYDAINMSVLFSRKVIDNDTVLVCRADLIPIHEENRCGYQFALELRCHDSTSAASFSTSPPNTKPLNVCSI